MHVRTSETAEIPAIYGHRVRHSTASFEIKPPDAAEVARRHAAIRAAAQPWLVAEHAGDVPGYTYAGPYRPRRGYRNTVADAVYVRPDAIGQGIGRRLLTALIPSCEGTGRRQMIAVIGDSANHASIRLHESLRFRHGGLLPSVRHQHGRWLDSVRLRRALRAGATKDPDR